MTVGELKTILDEKFDNDSEIVLTIGYASFNILEVWGSMDSECVLEFHDLDDHLDELEVK